MIRIPVIVFYMKKKLLMVLAGSVPGVQLNGMAKSKKRNCKNRSKYIVGEYDILILSATESVGLKNMAG